MTPIIERQLDELKARVPDVTTTDVPGGAVLISMKNVSLPLGWNKEAAEIHFLAPAGYPFSPPDCFWSDADLRPVSNGQPQNSAQQGLPGHGTPATWFSWHLQTWNPNRDSLLTFFNVIQQRLQKAL